MSEPTKIIKFPTTDSPTIPDEAMVVTLTTGQLRDLISEAVREADRGTEGDGLLNVEQAARFLKQSTTYVYRNWQQMGGRKLGKNLRFTKAGLKKWIDSRGT